MTLEGDGSLTSAARSVLPFGHTMPAPTGRNEPRERDEDELDELPPLDGDARDEPDADEPDELGESDGSSEGGASLDDTTGEDNPIEGSELDLDEREAGWLGEPAESPDLDLGDVAIVDFANEGDLSVDESEESPPATKTLALARRPSVATSMGARRGPSVPTTSFASRSARPRCG